MQASLEAEGRAKAEALRIKKKLESDINELEVALDHANKANSEANKAIKRYQGQLQLLGTAGNFGQLQVIAGNCRQLQVTVSDLFFFLLNFPLLPPPSFLLLPPPNFPLLPRPNLPLLPPP